jgi:hypothetical protein
MPDNEFSGGLKDGWQPTEINEGWQPTTVKKGYQPSPTSQLPTPPQGGSGFPSKAPESQTPPPTNEKR